MAQPRASFLTDPFTSRDLFGVCRGRCLRCRDCGQYLKDTSEYTFPVGDQVRGAARLVGGGSSGGQWRRLHRRWWCRRPDMMWLQSLHLQMHQLFNSTSGFAAFIPSLASICRHLPAVATLTTMSASHAAPVAAAPQSPTRWWSMSRLGRQAAR